MKKIMIYPFGRWCEYIDEYHHLLQDLQPVCYVGLEGWHDEKREYSAGEQRVPLIYDFGEGMAQYEPEVIWFVDSSLDLDFETVYLPYMKMAIEKRRKIIASESLRKKIDSYFSDESIQYYSEMEAEKCEIQGGDFLKPINTPVIYVCGIYADLCEVEVQLRLRNQLLKRGVSFCQVGTTDTAEVFGIRNVPWFIMQETISDKNKTLLLNRYMKEIEESEKSEIFVVHVPGEMFAFSDQYVAGFGYLAQDYFYAASPDEVLMLLPYEEYSQSDLDEISRQMRFRYGVDVDIFCRTNKRLLAEETQMEQTFLYLTVSQENMKSDINNVNMYDLYKSCAEELTEKMLNILEDYGEITSL